MLVIPWTFQLTKHYMALFKHSAVLVLKFCGGLVYKFNQYKFVTPVDRIQRSNYEKKDKKWKCKNSNKFNNLIILKVNYMYTRPWWIIF